MGRERDEMEQNPEASRWRRGSSDEYELSASDEQFLKASYRTKVVH